MTGAEYRADVPFGDKSMLQIVKDAIASWKEPLVIGGSATDSARHLPGGETFLNSLTLAVDHSEGDTFLLLTVDLPFLTESSVQEFLDKCDPLAGINYPIVPLANCHREFPGIQRTSLALREGRFTGGNIALMRKAEIQAALPVMRHAYEQRKNPAQLAKIVGFTTLVRVIMGKAIPQSLPISALESSVSRFLKTKIKGVIVQDPAVGTDVDSAEQYQALLHLQKSK